jgi:cell division topological specificity factor
MSLLSLFRRQPRSSADTARERLQILLAHERAGLNGAEFLPQMQRELLEVIRKYVQVDDDRVQVNLDNDGNISVLEVNIELPAAAPRHQSQ